MLTITLSTTTCCVLPPSSKPTRQLRRALDARDAHAGVRRDAPLLERARRARRTHRRRRRGAGAGSASSSVTSAPDVGEERRELAADRAGADDRDAPGHLLELEHVIGREDALPVELEPGKRARRRAGREDQRVAAHLGAVGETHRGIGAGDDRAGAGDDVDLAPLEQRLEPARQPVDDLLLAGLARAEVERRRARVDAELLGAAHRAEHLGGLEQLLGRDAAAVQAGAADALLLDERDAQAGRRAVERGRVPAGSATEDDDIDVFGHALILALRVADLSSRTSSRVRPTAGS